MLKDKNIIYFGSNDWTTGVKTSTYHVARQLARYNRVLYVDSIGQRNFNASRRDFKRIFHKLFSFFRGIRQYDKNLYGFIPLAIPFHKYRIVRMINTWLLILSVNLIRILLGFRSDLILWIFPPQAVGVVGHMGEDLVVYYCIDEYAALPNVDYQSVKEMENRLVDKADVVFVTAETLLPDRIKRNPNTHIALHGVDIGHFANTRDAQELLFLKYASITKPVIGYFGAIAEWVDQPLIKAIADHYRAWTIVMIGDIRCDVSLLKSCPNILFTGLIDFYELPKYAQSFDVCILPFIVNRVTYYVNPIKLRDYLAMGKPVVTTYMKEVERYKDVVHIGRNTKQFVEMVGKAARENSPEWVMKRQQAIRSDSWSARVEYLSKIIEEKLANA